MLVKAQLGPGAREHCSELSLGQVTTGKATAPRWVLARHPVPRGSHKSLCKFFPTCQVAMCALGKGDHVTPLPSQMFLGAAKPFVAWV